MTQRAVLAGAAAPGRVSQARQDRGQTKHKSDPAALQDGRGQSKAKEAILREMCAEDGCIEPTAQSGASVQRFTVQCNFSSHDTATSLN